MPKQYEDSLIGEIDEALDWVSNEYGFVTDVLKKAKEEILRLHKIEKESQNDGWFW